MSGAGGGLVQIFGLDSDCSEPDGTTSTSKQGVWLQVSESEHNSLSATQC
jgi:hypothetical protein